ncbi:hypothetical protein MSAN_02438400 [Mycena sanguinolenta]|uniref:Uncharacterized protein n=1 Tax=Mycena sanguinolenta TaxID=230812 RepID=A0A8H7CCL6_9AGAR|nr:hypothetical protein MSAN_02438400 [Mycena sanguinolenta]
MESCPMFSQPFGKSSNGVESEQTVPQWQAQKNSQPGVASTNVLEEDCRLNPATATPSSIMGLLLEIMAQVKTSTDTNVLAHLAAPIEHVAPILTRMAKDDPNNNQGAIIQNLQTKLASMLEELKATAAKYPLGPSSNLKAYNTAQDLDKKIAEFITARNVATFFRELVDLKKSLESDHSESNATTVVGDITGGAGGAGSDGYIGGEGGEGGGPELDMDPDERWKIGNISGGTGGNGGNGVERGGKGGVGKGPVISLQRNRS